ncbi:MAG: hypothetical protein JO080_13560 [Mucilaginibacter sp.]|nr:hypothetical protein [Mucilaginibacter sp.]
MKPLALFLSFYLLVIIFSCNKAQPVHHNSQKTETPKPLQDDNKDISFLSKRSDDDLVNEIYADLAEKSSDLKNLEDTRRHFSDGHKDSLMAFNKYNSKSDNYYSSAMRALTRVKDSVIKQRLRLLLINSQKKYSSKISKYNSLIDRMHNDEESTSNYYTTLQLAATLPVIEEYQDEHLSEGQAVEAIAKESTILNRTTKKIAEKYEAKLKQ